jgi:flagella basal body P-ring formation protein FlgA
MYLFMAFGPGGGFINELSAGETQTIQTNAPLMRSFAESDVLALLTATLQRDFVKDRGELELSFKQTWSAPRLPDEPLTVKILELPTVGVTPSFIVRFQLCTARESLGTWQTTVQAHVWRDVWVAHTNLRRGEPVNGADIVHQRFDVLNVREALAEFSAADPNLELAEPVSSGVPLLARGVKSRAIIHRGQVANALVQDGALSITAKVEALEDGAAGETIRARNPVSRRNLSGKVLDGQTILISL